MGTTKQQYKADRSIISTLRADIQEYVAFVLAPTDASLTELTPECRIQPETDTSSSIETSLVALTVLQKVRGGLPEEISLSDLNALLQSTQATQPSLESTARQVRHAIDEQIAGQNPLRAMIREELRNEVLYPQFFAEGTPKVHIAVGSIDEKPALTIRDNGGMKLSDLLTYLVPMVSSAEGFGHGGQTKSASADKWTVRFSVATDEPTYTISIKDIVRSPKTGKVLDINFTITESESEFKGMQLEWVGKDMPKNTRDLLRQITAIESAVLFYSSTIPLETVEVYLGEGTAPVNTLTEPSVVISTPFGPLTAWWGAAKGMTYIAGQQSLPLKPITSDLVEGIPRYISAIVNQKGMILGFPPQEETRTRTDFADAELVASLFHPYLTEVYTRLAIQGYVQGNVSIHGFPHDLYSDPRTVMALNQMHIEEGRRFVQDGVLPELTMDDSDAFHRFLLTVQCIKVSESETLSLAEVLQRYYWGSMEEDQKNTYKIINFRLTTSLENVPTFTIKDIEAFAPKVAASLRNAQMQSQPRVPESSVARVVTEPEKQYAPPVYISQEDVNKLGSTFVGYAKYLALQQQLAQLLFQGKPITMQLYNDERDVTNIAYGEATDAKGMIGFNLLFNEPLAKKLFQAIGKYKPDNQKIVESFSDILSTLVEEVQHVADGTHADDLTHTAEFHRRRLQLLSDAIKTHGVQSFPDALKDKILYGELPTKQQLLEALSKQSAT